MKTRLFCLTLSVLFVGLCSESVTAETKADAAFTKLHALAGVWEGTYAWSGTEPKKAVARYSLTGNGSAVTEDLFQEGVPTMTSVYHLDGADLRLTHFCAAQNQPRLKATDFDSEGNKVTFSFVDITNLKSPSAGHVDGVELKFLTADHINLRFHFVADGKGKDELFDLIRKK